jgi:hypothetical protein
MSALSPPIIDRFLVPIVRSYGGYGDPYKVLDLRRGVPQYTFVCVCVVSKRIFC